VSSGDFFLASVLATCLTKLVIRLFSAHDIKIVAKNSFCVEVLLILTALLKLGGTHVPKTPIDPDSYARVCLCIKTLASPQVLLFGEQAFLRDCRDSFASLLLEQRQDKEDREAKKEKKVEVQADDLLSLHQLLGCKQSSGEHGKDLEAVDLIRATGFVNTSPGTPLLSPLIAM
jgi:coatomer subunit beta